MNKILLPFCLGLIVVFSGTIIFAEGASAPAPTTQAAESAEAAVRAYSELLKSGRGAEAVENYWDMDAMFVGMFGDDMRKVSDTDRTEMRRLMLGFLKKAYANAKVLDLMASATFSGFNTRATDADHAVVSFTLVAQGTSIPNELTMVRHEGRWHIVDGATNGQGLCAIIHKEYVAMAATLAPFSYIKLITSQESGKVLYSTFQFQIPKKWSSVQPDRGKTAAMLLLNGTAWNNADGMIKIDVGRPTFPTAKELAIALAGKDGKVFPDPVSVDGIDGVRIETSSIDMSRPRFAIIVFRDGKVYMIMAAQKPGTDVSSALDHVVKSWTWVKTP